MEILSFLKETTHFSWIATAYSVAIASFFMPRLVDIPSAEVPSLPNITLQSSCAFRRHIFLDDVLRGSAIMACNTWRRINNIRGCRLSS